MLLERFPHQIARRPTMKRFTYKFTDFETGEIIEIDTGTYLTITEVSKEVKLRRSRLVECLIYLGIMAPEYDEYRKQYRNRLTHEAAKQGIGYRLLSKDGLPFDVINTRTVEWLKIELPRLLLDTEIENRPHVREAAQALDAFSKQRNNPRGFREDVEAGVRWLAHFFPDLQQIEVAAILRVSERQVRKLQSRMTDQLRFCRAARQTAPGEVVVSGCSGLERFEDIEAVHTPRTGKDTQDQTLTAEAA
jgi:hypothetical protein